MPTSHTAIVTTFARIVVCSLSVIPVYTGFIVYS